MRVSGIVSSSVSISHTHYAMLIRANLCVTVTYHKQYSTQMFEFTTCYILKSAFIFILLYLVNQTLQYQSRIPKASFYRNVYNVMLYIAYLVSI